VTFVLIILKFYIINVNILEINIVFG